MRRVPITLGRQAKDFQKWSGTKAEQNGPVSRRIEAQPRTNLPGLATNQASQNRPQLPTSVRKCPPGVQKRAPPAPSFLPVPDPLASVYTPLETLLHYRPTPHKRLHRRTHCLR